MVMNSVTSACNTKELVLGVLQVRLQIVPSAF